jgi:hypothetical protein
MQFAYQTQQLNSEARLAILLIALEQKVGSNPSSPATPANIGPHRATRTDDVMLTGADGYGVLHPV